jgi:hypothetical protein
MSSELFHAFGPLFGFYLLPLVPFLWYVVSEVFLALVPGRRPAASLAGSRRAGQPKTATAEQLG